MLTYLINLEHRKDRLENATRQLKEQDISLDLHIFKAVNGKEMYEKNNLIFDKIISPRTRYMLKHPDEASNHAQILTLGAIGCSLSHISVASEFLKTDEEYCLVLEDDISIKSSMRPIIEKFKNNKIGPDILHLNKGLFIGERLPFGTQAYMMNRKAAKVIIENAYPLEVQFDSYLNTLFELNLIQVEWNKENIVIQNDLKTDIQKGTNVKEILKTIKMQFSSKKIIILLSCFVILFFICLICCFKFYVLTIPTILISSIVLKTFIPWDYLTSWK